MLCLLLSRATKISSPKEGTSKGYLIFVFCFLGVLCVCVCVLACCIFSLLLIVYNCKYDRGLDNCSDSWDSIEHSQVF